MKVEMKENADIKETLVEIQCKIIDQDILKLERHIRLFSKTLLCKKDNGFIQIPVNEIFYLESVDRKTFIYTSAAVFETDFRLYELEDRLEELCCKGWMSNPLLKQQDSQIIRSRMKRFHGKEHRHRINRQAA